jgi:ATP-dependent helicase/nuclease subunit A
VDIPLLAALASPIFCFTADDLAAIRSCKRTGDFLDAMEFHETEKTQLFLDTLSKLRTCAHRESLTVLLEQLFRLTHLESVYGAMEDGKQRLANLQAFFQLAAAFEAGGSQDLGRFLEHLDALEAKGLISAGEASTKGCVTIMSIHKSKGLEYPIVFLCGLGREFNMESQRAPILCHKSMGLGLFAADGDKRIRYPTIAKRAIAAKIGEETLSEELRVLYVAMTRAKDRLIMTYASNRLQKDLSEIVQRLNMGGKDLLIREAVCPGDWVLLTALQKTEAGQLFALAGRPDETASSEHVWKISVVRAPDLAADDAEEEVRKTMPSGLQDQLQAMLSFRYDHAAAITAPSKMTATQRKGRFKDEEAAENTQAKIVHRQWRKPGFAQKQGKDYGNAFHAVLQYIDYAACIDEEAVSREIQRLADQKYISLDQAQMVDSSKIAAFFDTPIGKMLRSGEVIREFKFSILEDGCAYDPALKGEQILLQGVVDCALIEDDGITVVDFKTDYVTEETVSARAQHYRPQVEAYGDALRRIYQKPVKNTFLYFFHIDSFVEM